ncbi:MAG TPA: hypothetical protein VFZ24_13480 [Longimicrobiales bacterium]
MNRVLRRAVVILCLGAAAGACGSARGAGSTGGDRNLITLAEIQATHHASAFALIQALRPHWLEIRGPASGGGRAQKRVYLDDLPLGGLDQLRQIPTSAIDMIRYFDGPSATQQWGSDHSAGVIQVHSRSGG